VRGWTPGSGRPEGADLPILHVDMDAFFVSVELLDQPELRGRPVVVGGAGDRGVVAAASYEARAYGVFSAMPASKARRLCPHALFLRGRYARYAEVSAQVFDLFRSFTPLVEGISLDEAFLDVSGAHRLFGDSPAIAAALRARMLAELGLTCSVGVAPRKLTAKLASEEAKPKASLDGPVFGSGVHVVTDEQELSFLHALPVRALWGVGPATGGRLERLGVRTVGDLAAIPAGTLARTLGKANGRHLHDLAWARDHRPVVPVHAAKSVGHEETYAFDHVDHRTLDRELVRLADATASRLRGAGLAGRTVQVKIRFGDLRTITRSVTVPEALDTGVALTRAARPLLLAEDVSSGVRLLGVSVSQLSPSATRQLSLDDTGPSSWADATRAIDEVRGRYGATSLVPATLVDPHEGARVKARGDQQWGPDEAGGHRT
ncbi:MAG: DNA polymerase IV, partial [Acidimicrobiales bacterium]